MNEVAWLKKQIKDGLVIKFRNAPKDSLIAKASDKFTLGYFNIEFVRKGNKVTGFELSVSRAGHIVFVRKQGSLRALALFLALFTAGKGRSGKAIALLTLKSKDQKQAHTGSGLLSPEPGSDVG